MKVNKLTSIRTQLPYEYYSMPYCRPEKILPSAENLGEVLRGDRIENSPYEVGQSPCSVACISGHIQLLFTARTRIVAVHKDLNCVGGKVKRGSAADFHQS